MIPAVRRDFSSSSLHGLWGSAVVLAPPTSVCPQDCPRAHEPIPVGTGLTGELVAASVRQPALAGAFPSAWGGRGWCVGREAAMAAPPFTRHSTMVLRFSGGLGFLQEHSCLHSSSLLFPSGCLLTANSSLLPRSALQTPCSTTQPQSTPPDTCLRLGHTGLWLGPSV